MSQATLDALTEDLNHLRAAALVPKLEAGLNTEQRRAFFHQDGPALVLAGAGSGKTTVLTRRVARLLAEGVAPERLFVATFTKKAADEMGLRLAALLGEGGDAIRARGQAAGAVSSRRGIYSTGGAWHGGGASAAHRRRLRARPGVYVS